MREAEEQRCANRVQREQGFNVCFSGANARRTTLAKRRPSSRGRAVAPAPGGWKQWEEHTVMIKAKDGDVIAVKPTGECQYGSEHKSGGHADSLLSPGFNLAATSTLSREEAESFLSEIANCHDKETFDSQLPEDDVAEHETLATLTSQRLQATAQYSLSALCTGYLDLLPERVSPTLSQKLDSRTVHDGEDLALLFRPCILSASLDQGTALHKSLQ